MFTTYYLAHLKCNHCGTVSPKDASIYLHNKVCTEPLDMYLEKGAIIDIDLEDIASDFYQINKPTPDTHRIRCAELWGCNNCGQHNFAELVFLLRDEDAVLEDIKEIELTPEYLDDLHYLTEKLHEWARNFIETPVFPSHHSNGLLEPTPEEIKKFREFLERLQEEKKE